QDLLEHRTHPLVDLVGDHPGTSIGQCHRQGAGTSSHLHDLVLASDLGGGDDLVDQVAVSQEVLSEFLTRAQVVLLQQAQDLPAALPSHAGPPNTRRAVSEVDRATSSGSISHTFANIWPVNRTNAGSLGRPRCGGGAR